MSYVKESLIINNDHGQGLLALKALQEYIDQFNKMLSIQEMEIYYLVLTVDGKKIEIKDEEAYESENFCCLYKDGFAQMQADRMLWDENHSLMKAVQSLYDAKCVSCHMNFNLIQLCGNNYGITFWQIFLENHQELKTCVTYKAFEYTLEKDDKDADFCALAFGPEGFVEGKYEKLQEELQSVGVWKTFDFSFIVEELKENSDLMELFNQSKDWVEKLDSMNDIEFDDKGWFFFEDRSLKIQYAQMEEVRVCFERLMNNTKKRNGTFLFSVIFMLESDNVDSFELVRFVEDGNHIRKEYCKI